jgi:hypothetical protein
LLLERCTTSQNSNALAALKDNPLAVAPPEDPKEFAVDIYFQTAVDKLRLRSAPSPNAAVVVEIPENARLQYLHRSGGQVLEMTLRGVVRKGRWHKVRYDRNEGAAQTVEGWVFAGAVRLCSIVGNQAVPLDSLRYDFFTAKAVTKKQFEAQSARYHNDFVDDRAARVWADTASVLTFDNHTQRIVTDSQCVWHSNVGRDNCAYVGQYPGAGLYLTYRSCEHGEIYGEWYNLVSKRDGTVYEGVLNGEMIPVLSPDQKWLADSFSADCGSMQATDFVVNDGQRWRTAFNLEMTNQTAETLVWGSAPREIWLEWATHADADQNLEPAIRYYKVTFDWPF